MNTAEYNRKSTGSQRSSSSGFTAIELVITLVIVGLVMAMGVPSFQSVLLDRQQSSQLNNLRKTMVYARSEAVKRAQHVSVCARATDTSCGTDWADGWLVYTDPDSGTPEALDSDDSVLKVNALSSNQFDISASAIVRPAPMQTQSNIRFSPRGRVNWYLGTVVLCDQRGDKQALGLIVNGAGSLRAAYTDASSGDVVVDATGSAVVCT